MRCRSGERRAHVGGDDAAAARRRRPARARRPACASRRAPPRTASAGNGRKQRDAERADAHPVVAQLVDASLTVPSTEPSATTIGPGVLGAVGAHAGRQSRPNARRSRRRAAGMTLERRACARACAGSAPRCRPPGRPWRRSSPARPGRAPDAAGTAAGRRRPASWLGDVDGSNAWVSTKPSTHTITGTTAPRRAGRPGCAGRAASWLSRRRAGSSRSRAGSSSRCGRSRC